MSSIFQHIIVFSLIPVFTLLAGGAMAIIRKPSGNVRSLILHFAAGVVFSVVAVELLPDIIKTHAPVHVIAGFLMGFLTMAGIRKVTEIKQAETPSITKNKVPFSLLIAIGVDIFIDGMLLGIGFQAGNTEGILLAIALSIELLSLGMATAAELVDNDIRKVQSMTIIIALAVVFFISALLGATVLHQVSDGTMEILLSFGLSALLFLVTEELLTEAHEEKETVWHTSAFFIGFLLFLILGMINL